MKRFNCIPSILLLALVAPRLVFATDATWVNNGTILTPPMIDATNVINNGTIGTFFTTTLFDTSNTRNFTNSGTMSGSIGFRLDTAPRNSSGQLIGLRKPLANFHNRISGSINALVTPLQVSPGGFQNGQLLVEATNLVNQGILSVGADGLLKITGTNVNLSRGGAAVLSIDDSAPLGSFNDTPAQGQFLPDYGVLDNYWGQTNIDFRVDTLISAGFVVTTPRHQVQAVNPAGGYVNQNVTLSLNNFYYDAISNVLVDSFTTIVATNIDGTTTNISLYTNEIRQAAFVALPPNDFSTGLSIEWVPSTLPTNDYFSALVTMLIPVTNVLTAQVDYNVVYFQDTLAGELDRGILANYFTTLGGQGITQTRRPRAYILSRAVQNGGFAGGTEIDNRFFFPPRSTTNRVTGAFAAYSGSFDNILYRPPPIPAGTATNFSGRTEVRSDSLDITRARIRGEGLVSLQTRHLVGSSNAAIDCENLSLDLGSTNGLLRIQDITKTSVGRVRGDVFAWSGQWSNSYTLTITNYDTSTNPAVYMPITNLINIQSHMLVYDARLLGNTVPAAVQQFRASATNIVMEDNASVVLEMVLKGQSFTLNGQMTTSGGVADWRYTNAPGMLYFTNNGTLIVVNEAHFGDDGPTPYLAFVNRGTVQSQGQNIKSSIVDLGGTNFSSSSFAVTAGNAKVENGRIITSGDIVVAVGDLKLNKAFVSGGNRLHLNVTNALFDNGGSSGNSLLVRDGFFLYMKPSGATPSDLLGTTFQSSAPSFASVNHVWAAVDLGPNNAGFANNVAIGRLVLSPEGFDPEFVFYGAGVGNAMYVDNLDLTQLSDYTTQFQIDQSLVIYYASASLNFTPPGGLTAEEYLDGQYGGRLRWVSTFAGPNSSVDVIINGNQTIQVNRALRNSTIIDSDSDGIPNFFDPSPFDGVVTTLQVQNSPPGYRISWVAAPRTVYRVETRGMQAAEPWSVLLQTTNTAAVSAPWSVVDTNMSLGIRQYRVSYNPNGLPQ